MDYGYEVSEAILWQYGYYKGADKDRLLDMAEILKELYEISSGDKWIKDALVRVVNEYEGRSN